MRAVLTALGAVLFLSLTGCYLEEDCPDCEAECWGGPRQCKECRKKHSCPAELYPQDDPEEPEVHPT